LGQRLARTVNGVTTRFVIDPTSRLPQLLAETNTAGNIMAYYTHGLGLIAKMTLQGESYQYHTDMRGSVIAISDTTQKIVNQYGYDPFGSLIAAAEQVSNPFKYIGQFGVTSEPFDLSFASRRFYQPTHARFLTKDPAMPNTNSTQALNEYIYSLNNPIILIDPSGLSGQRDGSVRFEPRGSSDKKHVISINGIDGNDDLNFTLDFLRAIPQSAAIVARRQSRDLANFVTCSLFTTEGACGEIGISGSRLLEGTRDVKKIIATALTGPIGGFLAGSFSTTGSYAPKGLKIFKGELSNSEAGDLILDVGLDLVEEGIPASISLDYVPTNSIKYELKQLLKRYVFSIPKAK
jgi:RHS repeat-associated protein